MNSMTGYASVQKRVGNERLSIEIKTLNSRYLDCKFKSSSDYAFLEPKVLEWVRKHLSRGYVEISLYREKLKSSSRNFPKLDMTRLKYYVDSFKKVQKTLHLRDPIHLQDFFSLPEVWVSSLERKLSTDHWGTVFPLLQQCLKKVNSARANEGKVLKKDILRHLHKLENCHHLWRNQRDKVTQETYRKLKERVAILLEDKTLDETRLSQEVAYLVDRSDISEELVRFLSHCDQFKKMVNQRGPIGKNLDFLIQEMVREANTIGSKVRDMDIGQGVIESKSLLEQIREQIQNVE